MRKHPLKSSAVMVATGGLASWSTDASPAKTAAAQRAFATTFGPKDFLSTPIVPFKFFATTFALILSLKKVWLIGAMCFSDRA